MADLSVTAASVLLSSGAQNQGVAGEALTAGQVVYVKTSDSKIYKAQANGAAELATAGGIALHAAAAGQPIAYAGNGAIINIGATTAKNITYVVSAAAAGGVAPSTDLAGGNRISRLGYATATDGTFKIDIAVTGVTV